MKISKMKSIAAAFAAFAVAGAATAATFWSGEGGEDTLTSNQSNWYDGRADDAESMGFNGQGGKTVTFDKYYSLTNDYGYVWIGEDGESYTYVSVTEEGETNVTPVVFRSLDGSDAYGFTSLAHLGIGDNAGQRGALLIESGKYVVGGDIVIGKVEDDAEGTAVGYLTMTGTAQRAATLETAGNVVIGRNAAGTLTIGSLFDRGNTLTAKGITSGGDGTFNFNWGTLVAATNNDEFIASDVKCVIGGEPVISTAYPIEIPAKFGGEGTLRVHVTAAEGSVIMPIPESGVILEPEGDTKMSQDGTNASFYHSSVFLWTDSDAVPPDDANVVVPVGAAIEFTPTATNRVNSLRIDGKLTINTNLDHPTYRLLTETGLTVSGTGTLAFPSVSANLYEESYVELADTITLLLQRTTREVLSINDGETLMKFDEGSVISGTQVKISGSSRTVSVSTSAEGKRVLIANALPPDWTRRVTERGQIVWDEPVTITGNGDLTKDGVFTHGYFHNYPNGRGNPVSYAVDGISFERFYQYNVAAEPHTWISYSAGESRLAGIDLSFLEDAAADYLVGLAGAMRSNSNTAGGSMDITIKGLTEGHAYLIQMFCMDPTALTGDAARMYVGSTNGTDRVEVLMNVNAATQGIAGPGQYVIGRFVADGETQTFRISSTETSVARENMIQWRDITKDVTWGGTEDGFDGTWNFSGENWAEYTQEYSIWTNSVVGYVHSAVVDTNATLTVNGTVYAARLSLSNDAKVVVPQGAQLNINSTIIATTNATFQTTGNGSINVGEPLVMDGYGTFNVVAASVTNVLINAGIVARGNVAARPTSLEFGDRPLCSFDGSVDPVPPRFADTTARDNGYHALYSSGSNVALNSISGSGHITARDCTVALTNRQDIVFAGSIIAKTLVKAGSGRLGYIARTSESNLQGVQIDVGTLALVGPAELPGINYDFDASQTNTVVVENGVVTRWKDSVDPENSAFYLTPRGPNDDDYDSPTLTTDINGMPSVSSPRLRLVSSAAENIESSLAVLKYTDGVVDTRIFYDQSDGSQRWRIRLDGNVPVFRNYKANFPDTKDWISVNGQYNAPFTTDAAVLSVPWNWSRSTGRVIGYGFGAAMAFGEIISFGRTLNVEEKLAIEDYLMRKWGISAEAYKPFGDAAVVVGRNGTLDAGGQAVTLKSLRVLGTLRGAANITVTGDVTFVRGSRIYLDEGDAANGVMNVLGNAEGANNVAIYEKRADGTYSVKYGMKLGEDNKLHITRPGFSVRIR